jgi:butyrate kinase
MTGKTILIINPGSTSTKVAIHKNGEMMINESITHTTEELKPFETIWDQYDYRKESILKVVEDSGLTLQDFDAIACRGGNTKPIPGGIYQLNPKMLEDMKSGLYGRHATNVGGLIGYDLGQELDIPILTMDPPITDEFHDVARYSGIPQIERIPSFHALNQKATARKIAAEHLNATYAELNLIVVHLGGGISVGAHEKGKVLDCNNAFDGDGPFSPERAGTLPAGDLVNMCFSGDYDIDQIRRLLTGGGGLVAYLGTTDGREIVKRIENGDEEAKNVFEAMAYQTAKEVGACATILKGKVDAICITGSLAYSPMFVDMIKERVSFIADVYINPGENEMFALAEGVLRYLNGEEGLVTYNPK